METISRFLQPIVQYPFATEIHWILCAVAGFLIVNSTHRGGAHTRVVAVVMVAWWNVYEYVEFLRIQDTVDLDVANGFAAFLVSVFLTWLYHRIRKWYLDEGRLTLRNFGPFANLKSTGNELRLALRKKIKTE